ncbi:phosphotransferase [Terrabacter sp. AAH1]
MTTTTRDEAVDALGPFAQLPDWLAALMVPGRLEASLRAHVPELRDGRLALLECRADRLRAKEASWLARCRAVVAPASAPTEPGGPTEESEPVEVVLVGELFPPTRPDPAPSQPAQPATSTERVGFGQPGYELFLPDLRLRLRTEDEDPGLPSLGALTQPGASARIIQRMLRAGAYPTATVASSTPNVVRYKPGSRCTILYDLAYDPPSSRFPNPVVAKTHQGDKGAVAHEAMTALWQTGLARGDEVLLAEPLGYLPDERVLLQGPVPEDQTLKELARLAFERSDPALLEDLRAQLRRTAKALAVLHTSGARYSRSVAWTDEVAETREVLDRLSLTVPGLREAGEPMLTRLEALDRATGPDPLVSAHHDFRPAQVLLGGGRPGFIDFDGAAMAEPALDLGRFRGKLRDIGVTALATAPEGYRADLLADRLELLDDLCDLFVDAYRGHAPVTQPRVLLWETIDLLTALLHTWSKVRLLRVEPRLAILVHQLRTADLTP